MVQRWLTEFLKRYLTRKKDSGLSGSSDYGSVQVWNGQSGRNFFHCTRFSMRSFFYSVPRACHGFVWAKDNQERGTKKRHSWLGRHHLHRSVDVLWVRTSTWCRRCTGWASEKMLRKWLRDVCKFGDTRLSYELSMLEQGDRLGRKMENGKEEKLLCKVGEFRSLWVNFRNSVFLHDEVPSWHCGRWD